MIKKYLEFQQARELLDEADILLFRNKGSVTSFFIESASNGPYSHVGVASSHGDNGGRIWECVEFKEGLGGRTVNLKEYVRLHPGEIDVYRVSPIKVQCYYNVNTQKIDIRRLKLNKKTVTNIMRKMTGLPYGWRRIWWILQRKLLMFQLFLSLDYISDDAVVDIIYPVCSTAVAYSFSQVGFDLVHNRSDSYTEPAHIANSPLLSYLFTLKR